MQAILFLDGNHARIYLLHFHGKSEVKDFFDKYSNKGDGFIHYLEYISRNGTYRLTKEQFNCWTDYKKVLFCELKKGKDRVSCFRYDNNRLLLATCFKKYRSKEKAQYKRAIRLKLRFDENPIWED